MAQGCEIKIIKSNKYYFNKKRSKKERFLLYTEYMDEIELKPKTRKEKHLPADAAGHIMETNIPAVLPVTTVGDVRDLLSSKKFDTVNYIYIVDKNGILKGVFPVKDVFLASTDTPVSEIMNPDPVSVSIYANKEHIAFTALKHNIKAIPVVDVEDKLLGVVASDTILQVLNDENIEDLLHSAGIALSDRSIFDSKGASVKLHVKKRLPWLVVGLFGGLVAALIISFFEEAIRAQIVLVAFIPAIVYIADAAGNQTQILFIRTLALERHLDFKKYAIKELRVVSILAVFLGLGFALAGFLWAHSVQVAIIVGTSVFMTVLVAMIVALGLPLALQKRNFDPAIASGPFATVLRDITNLLIYFSIARLVFALYA